MIHAHDSHSDGRPAANRIAVLGHRGMVGQAIIRRLPRMPVTFNGDLTYRTQTRGAAAQFLEAGVTTIINCAGRVGGILPNSRRPLDFGRTNLDIALNVCEMASAINAKLVYLGSSCMYPRECPQPMSESMLFSGPLEPTNHAYAWAKLTGILLCTWYETERGLKWLAPIPCNLYGPGDHYDVQRSHVIPALIRRFHQAKISGDESVRCWGTGGPRREFMHVDDCAAYVLDLVEAGAEGVINVGTGIDQTIRTTAEQIAEVVGYAGEIEWDATKPDGMPRKLLDISRMLECANVPVRGLRAGIEQTYAAFLAEHKPPAQPLGVATVPSRASVGVPE